MSDQPEIPTPQHLEIETMLSRKFGKEVTNYFSSSPLNRVSFLREDNIFLSAALTHSSTRFLLLNNLAPLSSSPGSLAYASYADVKELLRGNVSADNDASSDPNPFLKTDKELEAAYDSSRVTPLLLFLGLDERKDVVKEVGKGAFEWKAYSGVPCFALDVTPKTTAGDVYVGRAKEVIEKVEERGLTFLGGRGMTLGAGDAAIFAQSRALIDWNNRNSFCGSCGHPTLSINAGTKRVCPPSDLSKLLSSSPASTTSTPASPYTRPSCSTRGVISNLCFPRTDPTIIVAVLSHDGQRLLLGRSKRFPPRWYSTLAGFIEPAESVEDAVRREVWEESGVTLSRVVIHSTQPWPFPANLMIGAIGQCGRAEDEVIRLEHDPELEDARWFEMREVEEALRIGTANIDQAFQSQGKGDGSEEIKLRLPPPTAIANQLISAVVRGEVFGAAGLAKM